MKTVLSYLTICLLTVACSRKMSNEASVPVMANSTSATATSSTEAVTIPACVQKRIDSIKQQPVWNPPAEVQQYDYKGSKVFLFSANCCDQFNQAVDENCNHICSPSGGFTGKGDGKCNDFYDEAKLVGVVWKDERERK